jgi:CRISPR/Cas system CSM-associated protein Csm3 (group 7 of RAMP superfamily)
MVRRLDSDPSLHSPLGQSLKSSVSSLEQAVSQCLPEGVERSRNGSSDLVWVTKTTRLWPTIRFRISPRTRHYTPASTLTGGFRRTASTLLNEQGWNADAIERQLAHRERDEICGTYNAAQYLPEDRRMMQAWADYWTD